MRLHLILGPLLATLLLASACTTSTVSEPEVVVVPTPDCVSSSDAVANLKGDVASLGYTIEVEEVLHLTGNDALAFLSATGAPFEADEVLAWAVSGEGIKENGVYLLVLNEGCAVFETATDLDTLNKMVKKAAAARTGV